METSGEGFQSISSISGGSTLPDAAFKIEVLIDEPELETPSFLTETQKEK